MLWNLVKGSFEEAMYYLIALDPSLNSKFFISQFVFGLKDEIRTIVRLQAPTSVNHVVALTCIQEEELELRTPTGRQVVAQGQAIAPAVAPVAR